MFISKHITLYHKIIYSITRKDQRSLAKKSYLKMRSYLKMMKMRMNYLSTMMSYLKMMNHHHRKCIVAHSIADPNHLFFFHCIRLHRIPLNRAVRNLQDHRIYKLLVQVYHVVYLQVFCKQPELRAEKIQ